MANEPRIVGFDDEPEPVPANRMGYWSYTWHMVKVNKACYALLAPFMLFFIICIGRVEVIKTLGEAWVTSSWYTVNTKILTVSVIGIYMYYFNQIEGKAIVRKSAICIVHLVMGGLLIWGTFWNAARVPFEKVNLTQMQSYFFVESKEDLPVDGNGTTPLFKDLDTSWDAIELLKKYHLSLFRDYSD